MDLCVLIDEYQEDIHVRLHFSAWWFPTFAVKITIQDRDIELRSTASFAGTSMILLENVDAGVWNHHGCGRLSRLVSDS